MRSLTFIPSALVAAIFASVAPSFANAAKAKINRDASSLAQAAPATATPWPTASPTPVPTPNPAAACLTDVCGEAKNSKNLISAYYKEVIDLIVAKGQSADALKYPEQTQKLLDQLAAEDVRQSALMLAKIREAPGGDDRPVSGIAQAIANGGVLSPLMEKLEFKRNEITGKAELDEAKTRAAWTKFPKADQDWAVRVVHYSLTAPDAYPFSDDSIKSSDVKLLYRMANKGLAFKDSIRKEYATLLQNYRKVQGASDLERLMYFGGTTRAQILEFGPKIKNGSLSEDEARKILELNGDFVSTFNIYGNPKSPYYERPAPSLNHLLTEAGGDAGLIAKIEKMIAKSAKEDAAKIESCKTVFALNRKVLPTKTQADALRSETDSAKAAFRTWISANTKPPTRDQLLKEIDAIQFQLPPTFAEFEQAFTLGLRNKIADQKLNAEGYMKVSSRDFKALIATALSSEDADEGATGENSSTATTATPKKPEPNEYCDQFKQSPLSDATLTSFGHVMLSVSSASANPSTRRTIVAHEIGHNLMQAMSAVEDKAAIVAITGCLSQLRTVDGKPDTAYTQGEDFADAIAIATSPREVKQNPWCVLLERSPDNSNYTEGDLKTAGYDPHSSGTFRTLHFEYLMKGALPESCKKFIEGSTVKFAPRQCVTPLQANQSPSAKPAGARAIQSVSEPSATK